MNLNNLRNFVNVVEAGTISQAARESYTSQQALSDQIRRLEEYYQTKLLIRTNPVQLTTAGELVYESARSVLESMGRLEQQVMLLREPACRLVISTSLVGTPPFLPKLITRFQEIRPETEVQLIHPISRERAVNHPLSAADLMVGNLPFGPDVEEIPLFQDSLGIAVSEQLLRRVYGADWEEQDLRLRECATLEDCGFLSNDKDLGGQLFLTYVRGESGRAAYVDSDMTVFRCREGLMAGIFPMHYAHEIFERDEQMRIYAIKPAQLAFRVGIGVRKHERLSQDADIFIRLAKEYFKVGS